MSTIKIDENVFVRDRYGVRRLAFLAGSEVEEAVYKSVMAEQAENPSAETPMENKMLSETEAEQVETAGVPDVEKETQEPAEEDKPAKAPAKAKK